MEPVSNTIRWLMFWCGMVEMILFGGVLLGWADLVYLLKKEGFFMDKCYQPSSEPCDYQQNHFDLAFTFGAVSKGITSVFVAFILDHLGLRVARLTAVVAIVTAGFLLGFTTKDNPYQLYPATVLFSIGGNHIRLCNYTVANLFPKHKSTVLSIYNGAFSLSAAFFLLIKYASDIGLDRNTSFFLWGGCAGLMIVPTFFLFPKRAIEMDDSGDSLIRSINEKTYGSTPIKQLQISNPNGSPSQQQVQTSYSYFVPYVLHIWWFAVMAIATGHFTGSYNRWLVLSTDDYEVETRLSEWYGLCQIPMFITAPLIGLLMDYCMHKASNNPDEIKRKVQVHRAGLLSLIIPIFLHIVLYVSMFFNNTTAIKSSLVIFMFARPFLNSVAYSFIRMRFPAEKFNKLVGVMNTTVGIFIMLQFPIFMFSGKYPQGALVFIMVLILSAFSSPIQQFIHSRRHQTNVNS